MIIEYTEQGYWLASGSCRGRMVLAEGETRGEAATAWIDHVAGIDDDGYLGRFPFGNGATGQLQVLLIVCAWCQKVYSDREWVEVSELPPAPVSHGICDACRAEIESDIAAVDPDYNGYLNAYPIHNHLRAIERHDNGSCPLAYIFDDPAVERAYWVAQFYLDELQGEYWAKQYEEAWRRGEI